MDEEGIERSVESQIVEDFRNRQPSMEEQKELLDEHSNHLIRDATSQITIDPDTVITGVQTEATVEVEDTYCFTCNEWVGLSGADLTGKLRSRKDAYYLYGPPESVQEVNEDICGKLGEIASMILSEHPNVESVDEAMKIIEEQIEVNDWTKENR